MNKKCVLEKGKPHNEEEMNSELLMNIINNEQNEDKINEDKLSEGKMN